MQEFRFAEKTSEEEIISNREPIGISRDDEFGPFWDSNSAIISDDADAGSKTLNTGKIS